MGSQPGQFIIRIIVKDSHKRQDPLSTEETVVWHTLDRLEGHVIIQSAVPLTLDKVDMRIEGHSRVWISGVDGHNRLSAAKSSYPLLFQSHEITNIEYVEHVTPELSGYIAPFHFVVPKWAIVKDRVPNQCLNLPPSISIGQILPGHQEPEVYAQPNISYHLRAMVKYHTSEESEIYTLEAWKEIKIVPITEILPPTNIQDFSAEFIESQTQTFRMSMFGGPAFSMTLSISEPPPITLKDMRTQGTTSAELGIDIKAAEGNIDERSVERLPQKLRRLTFTVEPIFRAKTFYSTIPFAKLPGQTMLTLTGRVRLRDEVMKLDTLCFKPDSWQYLSRIRMPSYAEAVRRPSSQSANSPRNDNGNASTSNSPSPPRSWSTRILVPLVIPADLPPTFCSVLVARQYSLIVRIKVRGISAKPFTLEVPVQIIYSPPDAIKVSVAPERSRPDAVLDVENIPEDLPGYS